jgi:hypothetical protein
MSLVAISGNASGTGTLTIAAPNTNSNYTLTLPDKYRHIDFNKECRNCVASGKHGKDKYIFNK